MPALHELPTFGAEGAVYVVVESPRGSTLKLKYDPEFSTFRLSRPLPLGFRYPFDWGFIPRTRASDGDPVDALIISEASSYPGVVIPCRIAGVLEIEQDKKQGHGRERNDRVIAIPAVTPRSVAKSVFELPQRVRDELTHFFQQAVAFEGKNIVPLGWGGPESGSALIQRSLQR